MNKSLLMELARCEYIQHRENVIAVGNSGTGKTHIALGLGLAQREDVVIPTEILHVMQVVALPL